MRKEKGQAKPVRRKQDLQDKYAIRIQGGKTGLVEATSRMDINEFRVFATMLTMVLPEDDAFMEYEIRVSDIIKLFTLKKGGVYYEAIKDASQRLFDKKFIIYETKEGIEYKTTLRLIDETSEPVSEKHQNHIRLKFNPTLKPYLLQLKREYLTIDIRNIIYITSQYSVKLYMILKHQQRLGNIRPKYDLDRLRQILAVEEGEYQLYGSFKQQIIRKAINDIEKYTDLSISRFEEEKKGKAVSTLIFHVKEKQAPRQKELDSLKLTNETVAKDIDYEVVDSEPKETLETTLYEKVKTYKIAKHTVTEWLNTYPHEQVRLGIEYVLSQLKDGKTIRNVSGYITKMVQTPSLFQEQQEHQEQQRIKKQQHQEKTRHEQQHQERINNITGQYEKDKEAILLQVLNQRPSTATDILEQLRFLRQSAKPAFYIELAHDNYKTGIEGIEAYSVEEIIYNFKQGASFATYIVDWLEEHEPAFKPLREKFEEDMKQL